jgi:X-X-X-Leu-X-X-Gly heptad repeat protein
VSDGASKAAKKGAKKVSDGAKKVSDGASKAAKKGAKKVSDGASFVNRKAGWLLNPPEWIFEWGDSHGLPVNGRSVKLTAKNHVNPLFLLNQKFPIGANPKFTGKQRLIGQYLAGPEFENATAVCPVGKDDKGKRWQPDKSFTVTFRKPGTPVGEEILKAYVQGIAHVLAPVPDMPPTLKVNDVAGWFVDKLEGSLVPAPFIPTAGKYAADTFTEKLFNYFAADTVITMTTSTVSSHKAKFGPNFFTLPCEISVQTIGNLLLQDKELMDKYPMEGTSKSKVLDYAGTYAEATVDFIMAPSIEKIAIEKTVDKGAKAVKAGAKAVKTGAKAATKAATKAVAGSKEKKAPR